MADIAIQHLYYMLVRDKVSYIFNNLKMYEHF